MAKTKLGLPKVATEKISFDFKEYIANTEAGLKRCTRCKTWVPRSKFGSDKSRWDGLDASCKSCRESPKRPGPPRRDRIAKAKEGFQWCLQCEAWQPKTKMRNGRCLRHNNENRKKRYAEDPDYRFKARQRVYSRKRKIKPVPLEGAKFLLKLFRGKCAYCPEPATTWDHIEPVSKGGKTTPGNIVPACASCNSKKRCLDLDVWLNRMGIEPSELLLERLALAHSGLWG